MDTQQLIDRVGENLSVRRAFGAAYERDGVLVIPVALVAGGGGGGEGVGPAAPEASGTGPSAGEGLASSPQGSGGGFGGVVVPLGAYVVADGQVRFVPVVDVAVLALVAGVVVVRLLTRSRHRGRRRVARRAGAAG